MYVELRSPNIHEPENIAAYNNTILNYRDTDFFLWAGGTEIMSRADFYPAVGGNREIVSLDKIGELHRFLRNDRYAEFGAMVSINEIAQAGKLVLPRILLDTINSTACRTVRERITIGGSLCTQRFKTSLASTLMILDAAVELRYMKKRMHSKWFQLSRIYDKNGALSIPEGALLSKVRIAIQQYDYQFFRTMGSPVRDPENALSMALVARFEQNSVSYARIIFTLPSRGFCYNRDLDNMITSLHLPVSISRYGQVEDFVLDFIKDNFKDIPHLQESRIRGAFHDMIKDMNEKVLSYTGAIERQQQDR